MAQIGIFDGTQKFKIDKPHSGNLLKMFNDYPKME